MVWHSVRLDKQS